MDGPAMPIDARFPDLAGRAAIVTGAGGSIGSGIAAFLGGQGMRLLLTDIRDDGRAAAMGAVEAAGAEAAWATADLATAGGARAVMDAASAWPGGVDLLVNNAAVLHSRSILDLDEPLYRETFEQNARIVYHLSHLVARHQRDRGRGGAIVNVSSVGGLRPHHDRFGYAASKAAVDGMTRSMAIDLARHGIRVNAVAPGATRVSRDDLPEGDPRRPRRRTESIPLGRLGRPAEIGAAVAFLASNAAAYITGQVLYVDGGLTAQLTPADVRV
jgi:NAD(P)-dependent dehydrogenase (short-subunit alcohol dehydrogenase family)